MGRLSAAKKFEQRCLRVARISAWAAALFLLAGFCLFIRAIFAGGGTWQAAGLLYIHAPSAWLALCAFASMGMASPAFLIGNRPKAGLYIRAAAPMGMLFALLCLITGVLWMHLTWGVWWFLDSRLMSFVMLGIFFSGAYLLDRLFSAHEKGLKAAAWFSLVGVAVMPLVKVAADALIDRSDNPVTGSFSRMADALPDLSLLSPLFMVAAAFVCVFIAAVAGKLSLAGKQP